MARRNAGARQLHSDTPDFPFVRITVLGPSQCGKTALVNSFVNNDCPPHDEETQFPELYYRAVRLPPESGDGACTSVCVEIEDTIAPEVAEAAENPAKCQHMEHFLDIRKKPLQLHSTTNTTPFGPWPAPLTTVDPTLPVYRPVTHSRMGYMIVFDVTNPDSFDAASVIHGMLQNSIQATEGLIVKPFVMLVANKMDLDPNAPTTRKTIENAESYSQRRYVDLRKCSARTGRNVREAFWTLMRNIIGTRFLWDVNEPPSDDDNDDRGGTGDGATSGRKRDKSGSDDSNSSADDDDDNAGQGDTLCLQI